MRRQGRPTLHAERLRPGLRRRGFSATQTQPRRGVTPRESRSATVDTTVDTLRRARAPSRAEPPTGATPLSQTPRRAAGTGGTGEYARTGGDQLGEENGSLHMHAHRQPVHLPPLERGIRLHSPATVRSIRSERCAQFAAQPIGRDYRAVARRNHKRCIGPQQSAERKSHSSTQNRKRLRSLNVPQT